MIITLEMFCKYLHYASSRVWFQRNFPTGQGDLQTILDKLITCNIFDDAANLIELSGFKTDETLNIDAITGNKNIAFAGSIVVEKNVSIDGMLVAGGSITVGGNLVSCSRVYSGNIILVGGNVHADSFKAKAAYAVKGTLNVVFLGE
jgi:hypothetical protein